LDIVVKLAAVSVVVKMPKVQRSTDTFQKFTDSIKILLIQSQIFGLVTFSLAETNFRPSKTRSVQSILMIGVLNAFVVYFLCECVKDQANQSIPKTTTLLNFSCGTTYMCVAWMNALLNRDKFITFLNKLVDFDDTLQEKCRLVNYQECKKGVVRRALTKHLFLVVYISFYAAFTRYQFDIYKQIGQYLGFFISIVNAAVCHQTIELVLLLKMRFAILNQQIDDIVEYFATSQVNLVSNSSQIQDRALALGKICTLHHQLSKLVKLFNDNFGMTLLLMFGFNFMTTTTTLFYVTGALQANDIKWISVVYVFMTSICYMVDTLWVCDVCYSTVEEVQIPLSISQITF
jgi:hypothetical protein